MTVAPIFIVGASRSGTSLARAILNNVPDVCIAGETHYFDDLRTLLQDPAGTRLHGGDQQRCEEYFLALSHRPYGHGGDWRRASMDRDDLRTRAEVLGGSADAYFRAFCELHAATSAHDGDTLRWGEKTPRHLFRLPELLTAFTHARVVVMVRDPRAVAASYSKWSNQGGLDLDEGYEQALEVEAARARASYDPSVSALLWRAGIRAAQSAARDHGADRVHLQRYEDLVNTPMQALTGLGRFLDVEVHEDMLDVPMHNSSFAAFDAESGVATSQVARWRETVAARDVATIQMWAGREMAAMGYELDDVRLAPHQRVAVAASAATSGIRAVAANRDRAGSLPGYVLRRLRSLVAR